MAALTLANILTRVKRNVPTTVMDTELQDAILERMNYITTLDTFPFQEKYQSTTLSSGNYRLTTPDNFATPMTVVAWMSSDNEIDLTILDAKTFSELFPKPDERDADIPSYCCIKIAESEIWFDCPASEDVTIRMDYYAIPDDATDTTVSQLTEMAKIALIKLASADGFRMMSEHDRADYFEQEGNKMIAAMQKRYKLSREQDARFISPKLAHVLARK